MIQSILQHECQTRATQVRYKQHECDTSNTSATRTTRVKNFDFDNNTSENMFSHPENIFSHPYISYIANERLQREEQYPFKNYLFTKTELCNGKSYIKSYTLDCSCKCRNAHINTASFSMYFM